jgi:hypothetical protein
MANLATAASREFKTQKDYQRTSIISLHRLRGRFAERAKGSERAPLFETQEEAIAHAKKLNPNDHPDLERVRNTESGGRDKWRAVKIAFNSGTSETPNTLTIIPLKYRERRTETRCRNLGRVILRHFDSGGLGAHLGEPTAPTPTNE